MRTVGQWKSDLVLGVCLLILIGWVLAIVSGCGWQSNRPDPVQPESSSLCGKMCLRLAELKCEEGKDVYNDDLPGKEDVPNQSCEEFCKVLQGKGVDVNPKCVSLVTSCDSVEEFRAKSPDAC